MEQAGVLPPALCPLNDVHLQSLNEIIQAETEQQRLLSACADCNLDVSKLKADSDRRMQLAINLKSRFFPHCS